MRELSRIGRGDVAAMLTSNTSLSELRLRGFKGCYYYLRLLER